MVCSTRYKHNNSVKKTPECHAKEITNAYRLKSRKLVIFFASDVVEDGNNDVVGPFQAAQTQFYRGQVIPICAGWVGETGEDPKKIIKLLAQ